MSAAGQSFRNPVGPGVNRRPVAVVAKAAAEGMEEHARPEWPLVLLDDASEDAILPRADLGADLADPLRLLVSQRADQRFVSPNAPTLNSQSGRAASASRFLATNAFASGGHDWSYTGAPSTTAS